MTACWFPLLGRRSFLHLGTEVARTGGVPADRAAVATRVVRRLRTTADEAGVDVVVALATAALRDAVQRGEPVGRLQAIVGSPITLLSGEEEARLCFYGQRAGVWMGSDPVLGLDLGGGSLEAGIGNASEILDVTSVALGTARLRGELATGDPLSPRDRRAIEAANVERSEPITKILAQHAGLRACWARILVMGSDLSMVAASIARRSLGDSGWPVASSPRRRAVPRAMLVTSRISLALPIPASRLPPPRSSPRTGSDPIHTPAFRPSKHNRASSSPLDSVMGLPTMAS